MPIVSSKIISSGVQKDGRVQLCDEHFDDQGRSFFFSNFYPEGTVVEEQVTANAARAAAEIQHQEENAETFLQQEIAAIDKQIEDLAALKTSKETELAAVVEAGEIGVSI